MPPTPPPDLLDAIQIDQPCPAPWDEMHGDDRRRFCKSCRLHVYNVVAMKREEALAMLREKEGRVCVRIHRRTDGHVVTADCAHVRFARARRLVAIALGGAVALFGAVLLAAPADASSSRHDDFSLSSVRYRMPRPVRAIIDWIYPPPPPTLVFAGAIAAPIPPPATSSQSGS